jgi:hypothetical protein
MIAFLVTEYWLAQRDNVLLLGLQVLEVEAFSPSVGPSLLNI